MITHKELHELFEYDLDTGCLLRNGKLVGTSHSLGYLKLKIKGRTYFAHRLVFLYCYGRWPIRLDHINRNKSDNRLENLRECSHEHNNANRGIMKNNSSGFKGVHWSRSANSWRSQVGYEVIGHFVNKRDAAIAYDEAATRKYGDVAVTNKKLGLI
jgi:hypothetical protein